ncbi:hypothetical protein [Gallibacterium sp. AGMB14963]|uniref:hypothetical protein n=1 Tax=Gallibacterium faecale TaxID=3019086 RepID=UPI0022F16F25|nr:hypothetical protein [Gallibacterium sp. AGMB14963]MDA3979010.1 hypothetical protein [Gallibacterium sp. AGMB14963]
MLDSTYIYQKLPMETRPFFKIEMAEISEKHAHLLDNIAQSIQTISQFVHLNKTVNVIVGSCPFELSMSNSVLSVQILEPALHIAIENFVFLDLNVMLSLPSPLQKACVMEELAHVLMNIRDEHLVKIVVAEMLPDVVYQNKQYVSV